jgi:hypothetical protein
MADQKSQHGMLISGLIMTKKKYPGKDNKPDRFGVDVAIPGLRQMLSVTVKPEVWGVLQEMMDFKSMVTFRTYKDQVYFEAI